MFESTAVHRRPHRGYLILPISLVLHAGAAGGILFASVWAVDLPQATPPQVQAFRVQATPTIPPAGPQKKRTSEPQSAAAPVKPAEITAPEAIPDVVPEPGADSGDPNGDPNSVTDGIPGGDPFSVVDAGAIQPAEPPVDPAQPMVPGGEVKAPVLTYGPPPVYPRTAIVSRVEGEVVVECVIDTNGTVRDVRIVRSSHFLLSPAAVEAVQQWRFRPGVFRGRNVTTVFQLTVTFKLNR